MENQISMRINLSKAEDRDIKSEEWTIAVRPALTELLRSRFPDVKMRLLEDPPGPPTQATFHMKIQSDMDVSYEKLVQFAEKVESRVRAIADEESIVDLTNSYSTSSPSLRIVLKHDRLLQT